eukprot:4495919-Amphidinium_carterae.1
MTSLPASKNNDNQPLSLPLQGFQWITSSNLIQDSRDSRATPLKASSKANDAQVPALRSSNFAKTEAPTRDDRGRVQKSETAESTANEMVQDCHMR